MSKIGCSPETAKKIDAFVQADAALKVMLTQFEQRYANELERLEKLREERNAKLDEAKRSLRDDAQEADITKVKNIKAGPFIATKKWQSFYVTDKLVAKLEDCGLLDTALSERIVAKKIEIEKFDVVHQFLERHGLLKDFEDCEDGREMSAAITGPKPITPFGVESKE